MQESLNIRKWGNSTAIRLPKMILAKFNLEEGDALRLVPSSDTSKLIFEPVRKSEKVDTHSFSERDFQLILDLLDNPPPVNNRLLKAAKDLKASYNEI